MTPWTVAPDWPGATVFIIGGGESFLGQKNLIERMRGRKIITINTSCMDVPFADFCIFGDPRWWWHWHDESKERRAKLLAFEGQFIGVTPSIHHPRVLNLRKRKPPPGLTSDRTRAVMERTTLQAAINVCAHKAVGTIVLVGIDQRRGTTGRCHHHKPHPWPVKPGCWEKQMAQLRLTIEPLEKRGIAVFNASPISLIDWWPKRPLEDFL